MLFGRRGGLEPEESRCFSRCCGAPALEVPALSSAEGPTAGCARAGHGAFNMALVHINAV